MENSGLRKGWLYLIIFKMVVTRSQSRGNSQKSDYVPVFPRETGSESDSESGCLSLSTEEPQVPDSQILMTYSQFHSISSSDSESDLGQAQRTLITASNNLDQDDNLYSPTLIPPSLPSPPSLSSLSPSQNLPSYHTPDSQGSTLNPQNQDLPVIDPLSPGNTSNSSNESAITIFNSFFATQGLYSSSQSSQDSAPSSTTQPPKEAGPKFIVSGHANLHKSVHCASLLNL